MHAAGRKRKRIETFGVNKKYRGMVFGDVVCVPPPVLEEVFVNVPPKEVVCVCRLVCREWKEVADSAALWRERCRRDRFRPHDITRLPTDWRLFYFLCKKRRNLLKNPSADEGLNGWQILENGGDEWSIEPLSETRPDGTATKYFVTSYETCKKCQLIDLVKEGYSQSFMDEIQPDIVISDWYAPRWDCGSMYEICVELLSRNKKVIRKFCPEPVYFEQWNDQKWQQMTHVFRDYGRGVCFNRFCHGEGHAVLGRLIPFIADACSRRKRKRIETFGVNKKYRGMGQSVGPVSASSSQEEGYSGCCLCSPSRAGGGVCERSAQGGGVCVCRLVCREWKEVADSAALWRERYAPCWDCGSMYEICVELLSQNKKVICKFCPEPVYFEQWNDQKWQQMTHVFRDYGQGVRFVRFCHGGRTRSSGPAGTGSGSPTAA
ncbi:hypothetical protein ANANG_G00229000 [Anguilla anguilla]|uniref:F-box domain-containing protein n=1 Tax=Anguilla anguilla TaxID=7936 RepID=A0A9D3RQE7_ANGAN|nr:hypothetical protein ANANG_G00229000 [Anguilla anguilla]